MQSFSSWQSSHVLVEVVYRILSKCFKGRYIYIDIVYVYIFVFVSECNIRIIAYCSDE